MCVASSKNILRLFHTASLQSILVMYRQSSSSIHVVFLRNRLNLGHTVVTSFHMHFENIGRGLLREGKRGEGEWAVWAKGGGMNRKYRSCKIKGNIAAL